MASSVLFLGLISLSFVGSSCNEILDAISGNSGDVVGTWDLNEQGGAQYDVCAQERVQFSTSQATLTCPGSSPITRNYTVSNGVLTYTETAVRYDYSVSTESGVTFLTMTGRNGLNRILKYKKVITDSQNKPIPPKENHDNENVSNSSEEIR